MRRVLVFGAGGFAGRYLLQEFLNAGYVVTGSDVNKAVGLPSNVAFVTANIMDSDDVLKTVTCIAPDMIINLAAISSVGDSWAIPQTTVMVNVVGGLNIIEAARKQKNNPKVMIIGSSEEYTISNSPIDENTPVNANNPYGISKVTQEKFASLYREQYGMRIYCVRPFNHTGVGQKNTFVLPSFCKQVAEIEKSGKSGVIKVGNLLVKRDFSHVKDIVRAYRMIIESDDCTKIYNVGYGEAHSLDEMLKYVISLSNQKIQVEVDPDRFRPLDTPIICCDRSLIKKELGWEPKYSVFDVLEEIYKNYLA